MELRKPQTAGELVILYPPDLLDPWSWVGKLGTSRIPQEGAVIHLIYHLCHSIHIIHFLILVALSIC
jgi:hypothetical protein